MGGGIGLGLVFGLGEFCSRWGRLYNPIAGYYRMKCCEIKLGLRFFTVRLSPLESFCLIL